MHVFRSQKEVTGSEAGFSLGPTGRWGAPGSPVPFDSCHRLTRLLTRINERGAESFHALDWKRRVCGNQEINFQPWGLPRRPSFSPESASAKEIGGAEPSARPWPSEEASGFGNPLLLPSNTQEHQDPRSLNPRMWRVCVGLCVRVGLCVHDTCVTCVRVCVSVCMHCDCVYVCTIVRVPVYACVHTGICDRLCVCGCVCRYW